MHWRRKFGPHGYAAAPGQARKPHVLGNLGRAVCAPVEVGVRYDCGARSVARWASNAGRVKASARKARGSVGHPSPKQARFFYQKTAAAWCAGWHPGRSLTPWAIRCPRSTRQRPALQPSGKLESSPEIERVRCPGHFLGGFLGR